MCLAFSPPFLQFGYRLATLSCMACVLGLRLSLALRQTIASLARCRAWSRERRNHLERGQTRYLRRSSEERNREQLLDLDIDCPQLR